MISVFDLKLLSIVINNGIREKIVQTVTQTTANNCNEILSVDFSLGCLFIFILLTSEIGFQLRAKVYNRNHRKKSEYYRRIRGG